MNRFVYLGVSALALSAAAPAALAQWTVVNLHPDGATRSEARGVFGTQQVGLAVVGGVDRASLWSGTATSWVDLHPASAAESVAYGISGISTGTQVVGEATIGVASHASIWKRTAASWVDLHPAGATFSTAHATYLDASGGRQQAGVATFGLDRRASLWSGTAGSWLDLNPAGSLSSGAFGASGTQQVGDARVGSVARASLWSGTAASWVDLHPPGAQSSRAHATSGTQQVGEIRTIVIFDGNRASLWSGTAASWVDLHPTGAQWSDAYGVFGTRQVGYATVGDVSRASLWNGTAASWEDLSLALPGDWGPTYAHSIWSDATTIHVVGYGYNRATGRDEALLWTRPIAAVAPAYLSGVVAYGASPSGASITEPGEYDNILGTGNDPVTINGAARGTVFALPVGVHDFTFSGVGGLYNALSLYLSDNGDPFSRPFASAPDLTVYGLSAPLVPAAGVTVQTNGQFSGLAAYSGAARFDVGGLTVSVTGYTFSSGSGSGTFELTVTEACYADCDDSGALDFFDFLCFQNLFAAGDPGADCDGSTTLDFFDFLCFQNAFAAGCQ